MRYIDTEEFLSLKETVIIIDVRSPSEYAQANIPKSINIPLFNDEERKVVGTIYKQDSKKNAIRKGLDFFGPKMRLIVDEIDQLVEGIKEENPERDLALYCWRGGMRSAAVAWLLELYGYTVSVLTGGYKSYRHWCLEIFEKDFEYVLIGGYTGAAKTLIIQSLQRSSSDIVIDLEKIANHKGSAFGGIGQGTQPSQESFENELAYQIHRRSLIAKTKTIVVEDESQRIGHVSIPQILWNNMKQANLIFIDKSFDSRLTYLVQEYGKLDRSLLAAAIIRLQKKLGGLETKNALEFLLEKDIQGSFGILLKYYDKLYQKSLDSKRESLKSIGSCEAEGFEINRITILVKNEIKKLQWISD